MDDTGIPALNPVPRSLLDYFLQELQDLGLNDRQIEGHLVFIRLWQKFLQPARLLDATPEDLPGFESFLTQHQMAPGEVRFALEAIEHFYAFTLDRNPNWEEHLAWERYFDRPPAIRPIALWGAITKKFLPSLRKVDPGMLRWRKP